MKRIVYFLLIVALLSITGLSACAKKPAEESASVQGLVPAAVAQGPYDSALAGAAKAGAKPPTPVPTTSSSSCNAQDSDAAAFAQEVVQLVNAERATAGLDALTAQSQLTQAAQVHSLDMGCNFFLSHTGSDGSTPFDRMDRFGYYFSTAGENVAAGYPTPQDVMNAWMNSEGHRANILNAGFTEIGIGYVYNPDDPYGGYYYWTMTLGAP